jgi:predicted dehydrogenase
MPFETLQIIAEGGMLYFNAMERKKIGLQFKDRNGGYGGFGGPMEYREIPEEYFGREGHKGLAMDFIQAVQNGKSSGDRDIERGLYIQSLLDKVDEAADKGGKVSAL